jgi:hypothetical protein
LMRMKTLRCYGEMHPGDRTAKTCTMAPPKRPHRRSTSQGED